VVMRTALGRLTRQDEALRECCVLYFIHLTHVSKATLEVALDDKRATEQFSNDEAGIAAVRAHLRELPVALVLMEATGGFERALAQHLCTAGMAVIVINPRQAHDFAKAMGYLAKTDHLDARVLSHFARTLNASERRDQLLLQSVAAASTQRQNASAGKC